MFWLLSECKECIHEKDKRCDIEIVAHGQPRLPFEDILQHFHSKEIACISAEQIIEGKYSNVGYCLSRHFVCGHCKL